MDRTGGRLLPTTTIARWRLGVICAIVAVTIVKLIYAATTKGTNDVYNFAGFAGGERVYGPIGMYGHRMMPAPYNHPPLTGWWLHLNNWLTDLGASFPFLTRLPATFADIVTALLVFELVRRYRPIREAGIAGLTVALSPILIVVSGYHGNTDPVFVMFAIVSLYLLLTRPTLPYVALAGVSIALAISTKLVPVVAVPVLLLIAYRLGRKHLLAFAGGAAAVFVVLWLPVVLLNFKAFRVNVLQYAGYGARPRWGLPQFAHALGVPADWIDVLTGPGRWPILLLSAGLPVLLAYRKPHATIPAFGLSLSLFLLLSTATATQYLAWAAAASLLINVWAGLAYNILGGGLIVAIYSRWSEAPPWSWDRARASAFSPAETWVAAGLWVVLLVVVLSAVYWWRSPDEPAPSGDTARSRTGPTRRSRAMATG